MAARIVQLNFKLTVAPDEYQQVAASLAETFAAVPGLHWKIWLLNEPEREAGGVYLFEDAAAAQTFLQGPLAAQVASAPFLTDLSVKQFGVMEDVTATTRGPVPLAAAGR